MTDNDFLDFLFSKVTDQNLIDVDMLDLNDDDSIQTALDFHKLENDNDQR